MRHKHCEILMEDRGRYYGLSYYRETQRILKQFIIPDIANIICNYVYKCEIDQFKRSLFYKVFNNDCSICSIKYNINVYILACGHKFHTPCIIIHINKGNDFCPVCKVEFDDKESIQYKRNGEKKKRKGEKERRRKKNKMKRKKMRKYENEHYNRGMSTDGIFRLIVYHKHIYLNKSTIYGFNAPKFPKHIYRNKSTIYGSNAPKFPKLVNIKRTPRSIQKSPLDRINSH